MKGWKNEQLRHSNARRYGKAGGIYAQKPFSTKKSKFSFNNKSKTLNTDNKNSLSMGEKLSDKDKFKLVGNPRFKKDEKVWYFDKDGNINFGFVVKELKAGGSIGEISGQIPYPIKKGDTIVELYNPSGSVGGSVFLYKDKIFKNYKKKNVKGSKKTKQKLTIKEESNLSKRVFEKKYKGNPNFITPTIESYGVISDKYVYELSSGEGMFDDKNRVYGVSILKRDGGRTDLGKAFSGRNSKKKAETYIGNLYNKFN